MNIATEVNQEILGEIAAESIAKINPMSKNGQRWINARRPGDGGNSN